MLSCGIKVFADDSKLYRPLRLLTDPPALQEDLNATVHWDEMWQLSFNATKCKVLHISCQNCHYCSTMRGTTLEDIGSVVDIGR